MDLNDYIGRSGMLIHVGLCCIGQAFLCKHALS